MMHARPAMTITERVAHRTPARPRRQRAARRRMRRAHDHRVSAVRVIFLKAKASAREPAAQTKRVTPEVCAAKVSCAPNEIERWRVSPQTLARRRRARRRPAQSRGGAQARSRHRGRTSTTRRGSEAEFANTAHRQRADSMSAKIWRTHTTGGAAESPPPRDEAGCRPSLVPSENLMHCGTQASPCSCRIRGRYAQSHPALGRCPSPCVSMRSILPRKTRKRACACAVHAPLQLRKMVAPWFWEKPEAGSFVHDMFIKANRTQGVNADLGFEPIVTMESKGLAAARMPLCVSTGETDFARAGGKAARRTGC